MTGRLGGGHSIADECESSAQLLLIELWSAGVPSFRAGGGHAVAGSLGNQPSFALVRIDNRRADSGDVRDLMIDSCFELAILSDNSWPCTYARSGPRPAKRHD